jgi:hypothetical protein
MRPEAIRRIKISTVIGVIALAFVLLGWVLYFPLFIQYPNLTHEYATAGVIADVQEFVENHDGQWPESWSDIGSGRDLSEHTVVRFDLTTQDFIDDPALIHEAIRPVTGKYITYPHAQRQLENLLETIKEKSTQVVPANNAQAAEFDNYVEFP